ncbi:MAG: alpha-rhamnosidase [Citrobacter freundii]|nr:MAG: alpha-rhamnosidase [Citrobacter freundii]
MKTVFSFLTVIAVSFFMGQVYAQFAVVRSTSASWNSRWIAAANEDDQQYGVYYFRKNVDMMAKPDSFNIYVSADNRYKLYVNGQLVSLGPARGDLNYWNYEQVDLAPYLHAGKNSIAATVWNEASHRPEAIISWRTGFIIQGKAKAEQILNTDRSWKCIRDKGYNPLPGFFAASTGEMIDMSKSIHQPMKADLNDADWPAASEVFAGQPKGLADGGGWSLVKSTLPQMEMTYQRIPVLRKTTGISMPVGFPAEKKPVTIPANTTAVLLFDQTYLTNAYLTLNFSRGKNAGISLKYAEALYIEFNQWGGKKGNRNEVEGKIFSGRMDSLVSDGTQGQSFTNLNFRTYRYIQMLVQTKDEPLVIDDIYGTFTGYPFKKTAVFNTDNKEITDILEIGWRTARLNAFETYTDCPYYEQLQYIGDTRVQAMITYYNSPDDRLPRNAINLIDHSRLPEGVTQSRYPTRGTQLISTFSLWYIGMLYDYWMYRADDQFIREKLSGSRAILDFFSHYQQTDGSLKNTPYWTFVDWAGGDGWYVGNAPSGSDGSAAILDLQLLWAYQWAAKMEAKLGMADQAKQYEQQVAKLKLTIYQKYWSAERKLFADTKEKNVFSQHANSLAVLTGMVKKEELPAFGKRLLSDRSLTQCTIYFKYYLHQALNKAGLGNNYLDWLGVWRENIKAGLTTWTEDSNIDYTRSDCHAWGSSPNIEFFRIVLGIDSDAPGFSKIRIEPHLGDMKEASGEIPHPKGKVSVKYLLGNNTWKMQISLPEKTTGVFVWKGRKYVLKSGANMLTIAN